MDWVEYFYNIAEEVKKKSKPKDIEIHWSGQIYG